MGAQSIEVSQTLQSDASLAYAADSVRMKSEVSSLYIVAKYFVINLPVGCIEGEPLRSVS
ncbi:hypothetical protein NM04_15040 [Massilia aurea]|uniref:Uncharacterized protein n=1 Tax=Massilia aurea TaxID=373040 RepID=A0A422QJ39_9BURK|nr:hypothetical protein NM04_15040 [Massilia aurea]